MFARRVSSKPTSTNLASDSSKIGPMLETRREAVSGVSAGLDAVGANVRRRETVFKTCAADDASSAFSCFSAVLRSDFPTLLSLLIIDISAVETKSTEAASLGAFLTGEACEADCVAR